jgi:isoleucyl-tRNA synthetase
MDKLYRDLTVATQTEKYESVHLAQFPISVENYVNNVREQNAESTDHLITGLSLQKGNDQGASTITR